MNQPTANGWSRDIIQFIAESLLVLFSVAVLMALTGTTLLQCAGVVLKVAGGAYLIVFGNIVYLRYKNPPITAIRVQRHVEAIVKDRAHVVQQTYVTLRHISKHAMHAVIAGEDPNYAWHKGVDWRAVRFKMIHARRTRTRLVGASSIAQQLAKNLFLPCYRSYIRKVIELTIVLVMQHVLTKRRILELYMNVVEWGDGLYGIEAAARHYYSTSAADISREQAARLVAVLPNPKRRQPATQNETSARILERMALSGW